MNDTNLWRTVISSGANIIIATIWADVVVKYVIPLLWEVHKAINVHGAR